MTNNESKLARIEELEKRRFYLSMKDRWNQADYAADRQMVAEIVRLKNEIKGAA